MNKLALVFPGQASQYVGMGKEFYEKYPVAKETFDKANEILGYDLKKIIFEGHLEQLTLTKYTQPAVFVTSIACFKVFTTAYSLLPTPCFSAGHSLGEYSALFASEVLSFEDTLKLVNSRANFLQSTCEKTKGTMLAILGAEKNVVSEICAEASNIGACQAVNFNAPGQIVISGEIAAIEKAKEIAKSKKIKAIPLAVSGAFHSSLMKEAAEKMKGELEKYVKSFKNPKFPVVSNCDAEITTDGSKIPEKLVKQIAAPVLWIDSINKIISNGCDTFVELGPKNIVSGMIKKISLTAKTFNIENEATLNTTLEALKNV
ncbi:MAG: [acyl-carrier-protein] S-malonyltransferase [Elusimicrobia bacterium HGW-Elusimicrobia-4]|nr:MAG: [acyl-carrier-protein] S-malonyltransferase [Elusimicrobia bacterium HGW-Elusimicrobia-4]